MTIEAARERAGIIREIREFFDALGHLEVDTPVLSPQLIPESNITPFRSDLLSPYGPSTELYLAPSPEIWMKRLVARGSGSIYQIAKCFRNGEQIGRHHNPEFTMLEWYTLGAGYLEQIEVCERLVARLSESRARPIEGVSVPFARLTMEEAFRSYAGVELSELQELAALERAADRLGVLPAERAGEETWESLFNRMFLALVEPSLPRERPLALLDYPARLPSLSRPIAGTPWTERWELYIGGVEVANCYTEETASERVRAFAHGEERRIAERGKPVATDPGFPELFPAGFPRFSGVALGVDRLVMLLTGAEEIGGVIFFPVSDRVLRNSSTGSSSRARITKE